VRFRDGERQLDAVVRTNSEEVAKQAVAALSQALPQGLHAGDPHTRPVPTFGVKAPERTPK